MTGEVQMFWAVKRPDGVILTQATKNIAEEERDEWELSDHGKTYTVVRVEIREVPDGR